LSSNGSFESYAALSNLPEDVSLRQAFNSINSSFYPTGPSADLMLDQARQVGGYRGDKIPKGKPAVCQFRSDTELQEWIKKSDPVVGLVVYLEKPVKKSETKKVFILINLVVSSFW
jgi:hypothetical protein